MQGKGLCQHCHGRHHSPQPMPTNSWRNRPSTLSISGPRTIASFSLTSSTRPPMFQSWPCGGISLVKQPCNPLNCEWKSEANSFAASPWHHKIRVDLCLLWWDAINCGCLALVVFLGCLSSHVACFHHATADGRSAREHILPSICGHRSISASGWSAGGQNCSLQHSTVQSHLFRSQASIILVEAHCLPRASTWLWTCLRCPWRRRKWGRAAPPQSERDPLRLCAIGLLLHARHTPRRIACWDDETCRTFQI